MDPVAALEAFDAAMMARDLDAIAEYADALVGWLSKGGFKPCGPHGSDWRGKLTDGEMMSMFRMARHIAEIGIMERGGVSHA